MRSQESRRRNEAGEGRGVDEEERDGGGRLAGLAAIVLNGGGGRRGSASRILLGFGRLGYPPPDPPSPAPILPGVIRSAARLWIFKRKSSSLTTSAVTRPMFSYQVDDRKRAADKRPRSPPCVILTDRFY